MRRRLFLQGPIGCGKSTLIKAALGPAAARAGGFVTLRVTEGDALLGFDLAPAAALAEETALARSGRFLSFEGGIQRDDSVFTELGAALLREVRTHPFAVLDEIGGLELLLPPFREALENFLRSDIPCVGVLKTAEAAAALARRVPLAEDYAARYKALRAALAAQADTLLLPTTGRGDREAEEALACWAELYGRK